MEGGTGEEKRELKYKERERLFTLKDWTMLCVAVTAIGWVY